MKKSPKKTEWLCISSHVAFLPAIYTAWAHDDTSMGALLVLVFIISLAYHLSKNPGPDWWHKPGRSPLQTRLLWADTTAALSAIIFGIARFAGADFPPTFLIAMIAFVPAFFAFMMPSNQYYDLRHSLWHIAGGIGLYLASLL